MNQIEDLIINNENNVYASKYVVLLLNYIKNYSGEELNKDFTKYLLNIQRINKVIIKKRDIIWEYRDMLQKNKIEQNDILVKLLCKKPSRSISGITSITLVMSPYPNGQTFSCEHDCYYCPNEPAHKDNNFQAQPRSYLYNEPAVRRANQNNFLAYEQMIDRMDTLNMNGHTIDKLEIILEGGTYTEYPMKYLEEYMRDIYYSANTYFDNNNKREKMKLEYEVIFNKTAKVHIIGICIETRPDSINSNWIYHFRRCGVTRIQLGVQSSHNDILKKINRGHTIEQAHSCMEYLKNLCFKIDIHIMPDLPFTTIEKDKECFDYVYSVLQPDQMKIYPCSVTPWTVIKKWHDSGKWKSFEKEELKEVMNYAMLTCPPWIRLPRVVRDIPNEYLLAGNQCTNLRQMISPSNDIRSREIERHPEYYNKPAKIFINKYSKLDYFISYESLDQKALFGFIRLRLPKEYSNEYHILKDKALIRELHVYGYTTEVGKESRASQHLGIGTQLLKKAESIAFRNMYSGTVVISGEGVKEYYSKKGYYEKDTFMVKNFIIISIINYFIKFIFF